MTTAWRGTFEAWQHEHFARIYAAHSGRELHRAEGLWVYISRRPLVGAVTVYLYCPPDQGEWLDAVLHLARDVGAARLWMYSLYRHEALSRHFAGVSVTVVLNLAEGEETLWKNVGDKTRNMIRKGHKNGIEVALASSAEDFERWWEVYEAEAHTKVYAHQPRVLVQALYKCRECSSLFVAKKDGRVVGGSFYLKGCHPMYWLGAYDNRLRQLALGHVAIWESIIAFCREGYSLVDLGGVDPDGQDGSSRFKMSFQGERCSAFTYNVPVHRIKSWLARLVT